jgi:hypothetical protein
MIKEEFQKIISDIDQAASQQGINLADPENTVTVWLWLECRKGSIEYRWHGKATGLEHAKMLAGLRQAIIRTTETGRVQIIVWKDQQWLDGYAEEDQPPVVLA